MLIPSFVIVKRVISCVRYYRTVTPIYGLTTCPHGQHVRNRIVPDTWATILVSFFRVGCCGFHVSVPNRSETANLVCLIARDVFRPRQTRQLPRAVVLKGRLLSCQNY